MKFFCNGKTLSEATNVVSKALAVNKNIPILESMKINASDNKITLSAYNQEIYIEKSIPANVEIEGELIVNGKDFNDYVNKISNIDEIEIEQTTSNNKLKLKFDNKTCEINYYEISSFPELGDYNENISFKIKEKDLKELLERVIFCAALTDNRTLLKSCNLRIINNVIESVCLDGYRLAISKKPVEDCTTDFSCAILGKIVNDIIKILGDSEEYVKVSKFNNLLIFDLISTKIKSTTVDCDFFKYENMMPKEINNTITINKNDILESLNRASIISRDHAFNNIIIETKENVVNILAESEKGMINEPVNCKTYGEDIKIGINNKFLIDAINKIKTDFVIIELESKIKPIVIKEVDSDEFVGIILPVRLV